MRFRDTEAFRQHWLQAQQFAVRRIIFFVVAGIDKLADGCPISRNNVLYGSDSPESN
jgi:hypothetical protein